MPIKKVIIEKANRLYQLPMDLDSFVGPRSRRMAMLKGEVIDLARFEWPIQTNELSRPDNFTLATSDLQAELKATLAEWYAAVHNAKLNPRTEVCLTRGVSASVFGLTQAFLDFGDVAFVPEIGLPMYRAAVISGGGEPVGYSVAAKNSWHPDFTRIETRLGRAARMIIINSPHNPTGATLSERDLANLVRLAGRENIFIVNDAAYQTFCERAAASLVSTTGGKKAGVELGSFSYTFGLPALPFGFAVGNKDVIAGLRHIQKYRKVFLPQAWVTMALDAIRKFPSADLIGTRQLSSLAASDAVRFMQQLNLERVGLETIPFVLARIEKRPDSTRAARVLFRKTGIQVMPGVAFGETAEGYLRLSLTAGQERYTRACEKLTRKKGLLRLGEDR